MPVGVCAKPNGLQLPTDSIPVPALHFPLSSYTAASWPLPDQWFWNTSVDAPATWAQDSTFGTVVDCNVSIPPGNVRCSPTREPAWDGKQSEERPKALASSQPRQDSDA